MNNVFQSMYRLKAIAVIAIIGFTVNVQTIYAQTTTDKESVETLALDSVGNDTLMVDSLIADSSAVAMDDLELGEDLDAEAGGVHHQLKKMFIDGTPLFMSLVALALVLGMAFCIERITYLTLSEINAKKLMKDIDAKVEAGDVEGAKQLCRETRGPVASVCYQGLMHINEQMDDIERSIYSYGSVQTAKLEKGTSWIKLFIAMAPSLGFLGTVIGMVMAFEQIQIAGDIGPTIVASGMKVALITTIFGIVVALILQLFYSYITSKIEHLTSQMEESVVTLLDTIMKYKHDHHG
jgi:biopolymer transport protein ExbB